MRQFRGLAIVALAGAATAANAGTITFSFADPVPGRQLTAVAGGGGIAALSYDQTAALTVLIDGTAEGFGTLVFNNARMELNMSLAPAVTIGGTFIAPVSGYFRLYDATSGQDIVTGQSQNGSFVRVLGTNSLQFATPDGFTYTAGAALQSQLAPGRFLAPYQEASFSLTDIQTATGGFFIGENGVFQSFTANSSYSGNSDVIPTPGALALMGLGLGLVARRRRA